MAVNPRTANWRDGRRCSPRPREANGGCGIYRRRLLWGNDIGQVSTKRRAVAQCCRRLGSLAPRTRFCTVVGLMPAMQIGWSRVLTSWKQSVAMDRSGSRVCENDVCSGLRERFRRGCREARFGKQGPEIKGISISDCCHERCDSEDLHRSFEVVRENMQTHFGAHTWQGLGEEMRRSHPRLERAERMLDSPASYSRRPRCAVQPLLHRVQYVFVFPA